MIAFCESHSARTDHPENCHVARDSNFVFHFGTNSQQISLGLMLVQSRAGLDQELVNDAEHESPSSNPTVEVEARNPYS